VLAAALLVALFVTAPRWHAPLGASLFALAWFADPVLRRPLGAPRRWLATGLVLALLGAWLGVPDAHLGGRAVSIAGALAATTMTTRGIALLTLSSGLMALAPPSTWVARLEGTRFARMGGALLVAVDLLPSLVSVLRSAHAEARMRSPGVRRAPARLFEVIVVAVGHASELADDMRVEDTIENEERSPT
jgi:hypothetical protein